MADAVPSMLVVTQVYTPACVLWTLLIRRSEFLLTTAPLYIHWKMCGVGAAAETQNTVILVDSLNVLSFTRGGGMAVFGPLKQ